MKCTIIIDIVYLYYTVVFYIIRFKVKVVFVIRMFFIVSLIVLRLTPITVNSLYSPLSIRYVYISILKFSNSFIFKSSFNSIFDIFKDIDIKTFLRLKDNDVRSVIVVKIWLKAPICHNPCRDMRVSANSPRLMTKLREKAIKMI